jgi:hypothetical protein
MFLWELKGEIRAFIKLFKHSTLEKAFESALYVKDAFKCQLKKLKPPLRPSLSPSPFIIPFKAPLEKPQTLFPPKPSLSSKTLIEQR